MTKISACLYAAVAIIITLAFSALINVSQASEWKTEILPVVGIDTSPDALIRFMKDHGEDIAITGNRIADCYGKGLWLSGYGIMLKVFKKTDHPEVKAAVVCQDYAGDYYIQLDDKVIVQGVK
jgi:hypothetical protein